MARRPLEARLHGADSQKTSFFPKKPQTRHFMQTMLPETEIEVIEQEKPEQTTDEAEKWSLVVFNDDVNTFEHVIETLIEVCEHAPEQAEQCTWIIHFKGKCSVKTGSFDVLAAMRNAICGRGISAEVL